MHTRFLFTTLAAGLLAVTALSQTSIWTPPGYAAIPGNSNNSYPWHRATAPMIYQQIYSNTNFTLQGVAAPVLISRLRFRAYQVTGTWPGGSWPNIILNMSTAATTYLTASATFASNHGPNLTNVYTGPITVMPGTGNGTGVPGPIYIDISLTNPFLYDPSSGDLCFEVILDGVGWSGTSTYTDAVSGTGAGGPALSTRVYNTASHTATTGTVGASFTLVTEFTYLPASGYAYSTNYGTGCNNLPALPFYEYFATAPAFDLANSGVSMLFNGTNAYTVIPGIASFVPPSGTATVVANADDTEQTVTLGSPFPHATGVTSALTVCSNGFVSVASGNGTGFSPSSAGFMAFGQTCFCASWHDYNPIAAGSGQIKFEEVGNMSYVTWDGVYDYAGTTAANANRFQYQFDRGTGHVHFVWQTMSTIGGTGHITGFKAAGPNSDPGSIDISALLPASISCRSGTLPLMLAAGGRPRVNSTVNLITTNVPAVSAIGAQILSFTQNNPGIDLTSLGMPGCRQYVGLDANRLYFPSGGTGTVSLVIPNNQTLVGLRMYTQSAAFAVGANALGVLASNGVALIVDLL